MPALELPDLSLHYEDRGSGPPLLLVALNDAIADGKASVNKGAHASPNMTMTIAASDYVDMITGKLNGQMAFMQGKLKLGGDVAVLIRQHALLDGLGDALGDLRDRTDF